MSGAIFNATAVLGRVGNVGSSVGRLANDIGSALGLGALQEASWRGIRFACRQNRVQEGRRVAVHEYPYRDDVWAEDLGAAPKRFTMEGFLLGQDPVAVDVIALRQQMLTAINQKGPGTLVHPTMGAINCVLVEHFLGEVWDRRNAVDLALTFVVVPKTDKPIYPSTATNTQSALGALATQLGLGSVASFLGTVTGYVQQGLSYVQQGVSFVNSVVGTVTGFLGTVTGIMTDAGLVASAVTGLADGNFYGRYTLGIRAQVQPTGSTTASLIAGVIAARATVAQLGTAATAAAQASAADPGALGPALVAVTEGVRAACSDPADAIRLLGQLATFQAAQTAAEAVEGAQPTPVQLATAALCRRAALQSIAAAVATAQPTSYDDAVQVQDTVTGLIDAETVIAADAGDSDAYVALLQLRTAVVNDLQARALDLPRLMTVTRAAPLPAWTLAEQLYGDGSRVDDLIQRVGNACPHPAWMPLSFQALSE